MKMYLCVCGHKGTVADNFITVVCPACHRPCTPSPVKVIEAKEVLELKKQGVVVDEPEPKK